MLFLRFKKVPAVLLKSREPQTHKSKVITLLILIEKYDSYIVHNWIAGGPSLPNRVELNFGKNQTQKRSRPLISWPISDSAINSNSLFSSNFILAVYNPGPEKSLDVQMNLYMPYHTNLQKTFLWNFSFYCDLHLLTKPFKCTVGRTYQKYSHFWPPKTIIFAILLCASAVLIIESVKDWISRLEIQNP